MLEEPATPQHPDIYRCMDGDTAGKHAMRSCISYWKILQVPFFHLQIAHVSLNFIATATFGQVKTDAFTL